MPTSIISNTLTSPAGTALASVPVIARLRPGNSFRTSSGSEIAIQQSTTTDGSGNWSLTLEENSNITPTGTFYEVEEQIPATSGGAVVWRINVGANDATLQASLISTLPSGVQTGNITQATADARYILTSAGIGWVDVVRDFGATADGVTDATAAIQAAHDSLPVTGGTLFFPRGTYLVSGAGLVFTRPNLTIKGFGGNGHATSGSGLGANQLFGNTVILGSTLGGTLLTLLPPPPASNDWRGPTVEGLTFIDNSSTRNQLARAIDVGLVNVSVFRDISIGYLKAGTAIRFNGSSSNPQYAEIYNLKVHQCLKGIEQATASPDLRMFGGFINGTANTENVSAGSIGLELINSARIYGTAIQNFETCVSITGQHSKLVGCAIEVATGHNGLVGIDIGPACADTLIFGNDFGNSWDTAKIRIQAGAVRTQIMQSMFASGNETGHIVDNGTDTLIFDWNHGLKFPNDKDFVFGTGVGTKIGTGTTQKIAFYNSAPIVQPAANADTSGATLGQLETEVNELKATLRSLGLLAT